jgi:hypothetical protein
MIILSIAVLMIGVALALLIQAVMAALRKDAD